MFEILVDSYTIIYVKYIKYIYIYNNIYYYIQLINIYIIYKKLYIY